MSSDPKAREPRAKQSAAQQKSSTGRAKKQTAQPAARHRGQGPFGMDSEQSARLLIFGVTGAVLIAVVAFLAIGWYVTVIQPRGRTVLEVDGTKVSYAAMKRRVAHEYYTNPTYQDPQSVVAVPLIAYSALLDELVLTGRGERELGLTIDQAALDEEERSEIGVAPDADEATYSERYRSALATSRLKEAEFKRKIRAAVVTKKAREKFVAEVPASAPQARVELIFSSDRGVAQQALDRVRAGEDWKTVATELSIDPSAATTGGLKEYELQEDVAEAYRAFAFAAAIGEISEPLQDASGSGPFYIVRVVDRSDQPLNDTQKSDYAERKFTEWLEATRATAIVVDKWTTDEEAQASAGEALLKHAQEKFIREQNLALTPQATVDVGAVATAGAQSTSVAQTAAAGASPAGGTPAATVGAGAPTPAPPGGSDGQ
jgi:parvulin-like peptidyl-prolyl isomerase